MMTTASRSNFVPAKQSHDYQSSNGVMLRLGDEVYQITFIEGTNKPVLFKFTIIELLSDGRIKIKGSLQIDATTNVVEHVVRPNNVHTNPKELLLHWLAIAKHQFEIELPERISGLETLIRDLDPEYVSTNLQIGHGLNPEIEI